jgi:hypothetical protein
MPQGVNRLRVQEGTDWLLSQVAVPSRQNGQNCSDVLVWREGTSGWQRADSVDHMLAMIGGSPANANHQAPRFPEPDHQRRTKPNRWTVAALALGFLMVAAVGIGGFGKVILKDAFEFVAPLSPDSAELEAGFATSVTQMRTMLPRKIDESTTLIWVAYEGRKMTYENRIEMQGAKVDAAAKDKMRQLITARTCLTAGIRKLLDLGGSFRYVYNDIDAKPVMTVEVTKSNCSAY